MELLFPRSVVKDVTVKKIEVGNKGEKGVLRIYYFCLAKIKLCQGQIVVTSYQKKGNRFVKGKESFFALDDLDDLIYCELYNDLPVSILDGY